MSTEDSITAFFGGIATQLANPTKKGSKGFKKTSERQNAFDSIAKLLQVSDTMSAMLNASRVMERETDTSDYAIRSQFG